MSGLSEEIQFRQKKRRKRKMQIIRSIGSVFIVIFMIGLMVFFYYRRNGYYKNAEVKMSIKTKSEYDEYFAQLDGKVLAYSSQGVRLIDEDGTCIWKESIDVPNPIEAISGNYVIIADQGGTCVNVFGEQGLLNSFQTDASIIQVDIASNGKMAILSEDDQNCYLSVYKSNGKKLEIQKKYSLKQRIFPVDVAISPNGNELVTNFLNMSSGTVVSTIAFFDFSKAGKQGDNIEANQLEGGTIYNNELVPKVDFCDETTAVIYREQGFSLYPMAEKTSKQKMIDVDFKHPVHSIASSDQYLFFLLELDSKDYKYEAQIYDKCGKKIGNFRTDFAATDVVMDDESIILHNFSEYYVYTTKGKMRFHQITTDPVETVLPCNYNSFFVVCADKIKRTQLT